MKRSQQPITMYRYTGLASGTHVVGPADAMPTFVSHNNIGLNYLISGQMRVLRATGFRYTLGPGRLVTYWGAVPHKVEEYLPNSKLYWLALPLGTFLKWAMPAEFVRQLIRGQVFFEKDSSEGPLDGALMERCHRMIWSRVAEARTIVLLELEARLRRLALFSPAPRKYPSLTARDAPGAAPGAERMLLLIAEHFREDLSAADVATAAGLHPGYASGLFKRHVGMGLTEYIAECRVSHAKALLATGEAKVLNIARESGFGSASQFHAVFKKITGMTPRAFRQSLRREQD